MGIIIFMLAIFFAFVLLYLGIFHATISPAKGYKAALAVDLGLASALLLFYFFWKPSFKQVRWKFSQKPYGLILVCFLVGVLAGEWSSSMLEFLPRYEIWKNEYDASFGDLSVLEVFLGILVTPILEEVFFRGILFQRLKRLLPWGAALGLSALAFGVVHLDALQIIDATFVGLVLGYIYHRTNNLPLIILIHIVHNAIAYGLPYSAMQEAGRSGAILFVVVLGALLAGGFFYIQKK